MHTLTFYPLGNADSCLVELANGRALLFDYANMRNSSDESDKRIDLADALRQRLDQQKRTSLVRTSGTLTARMLADRLQLEISTASTRLHKLYHAGLLARQEEVTSAGRQHIYTVPA